MGTRLSNVLLYALVGAFPGLALVLVAEFVIEGEMQLTVGAPGLVLAAVGAVLGAAFGLRRHTHASQ
jgi:hypothetical protein